MDFGKVELAPLRLELELGVVLRECVCVSNGEYLHTHLDLFIFKTDAVG